MAISRCAAAGMLHGALAGAIAGLQMQVQPPLPVPLAAVPVAALVILVVVLSISLFLLVLLERFYLAQVFGPTALNAALVTFVVVTVVTRLPTSPASMLLGWLVGTTLGWLIGTLLCRQCL